MPDRLTDALFDAIHAAAELKRIDYWDEKGFDFDVGKLATLFLAPDGADPRHGPEALTYQSPR